MKKILTGLQPTGVITLGNYIGAIKQMVKYQDQYDSYLFVADLHAITIPQDKEQLSKNTRDLLALYLACGVPAALLGDHHRGGRDQHPRRHCGPGHG